MRWLGICFAALCYLVMPAAASPESEAHVRAIINNMHEVPAGQEANFIVDQIDMVRLGRFILGRHGREMSVDEFSRFSFRLDRFLRDFLSDRSEELGGAHIEILSSVDRSDEDSIIVTRVWSPVREPMIMRWRVLRRNEEWRIIDFEIHGLWLAIEQRAQVANVLSNGESNIDELYLLEAP